MQRIKAVCEFLLHIKYASDTRASQTPMGCVKLAFKWRALCLVLGPCVSSQSRLALTMLTLTCNFVGDYDVSVAAGQYEQFAIV